MPFDSSLGMRTCDVGCFVCLEVSRDAVIGVYIEQGEDAKCGRKDVNEMRTTVQMSQYEDDELAREGVEYEKSRFLEVFKSEPEIIQKKRSGSQGG